MLLYFPREDKDPLCNELIYSGRGSDSMVGPSGTQGDTPNSPHRHMVGGRIEKPEMAGSRAKSVLR